MPFSLKRVYRKWSMHISHGYRSLIILITMGSILSLFCRPLILGLRSKHHSKAPVPFDLVFNPLTATASELQELLSSGQVRSVDLVARSLAQIDKYDTYLRAIISVSSTALETARKLDEERLSGRIRGPLHGIPILIKVSFCTMLEMFALLTDLGQHCDKSIVGYEYHSWELCFGRISPSQECRSYPEG